MKTVHNDGVVYAVPHYAPIPGVTVTIKFHVEGYFSIVPFPSSLWV